MRDRNSSALKAKKQLSVVSFGEHQTRSSNSNSNASGDTTPSEVCPFLVMNGTLSCVRLKVLLPHVSWVFLTASQGAARAAVQDFTR